MHKHANYLTRYTVVQRSIKIKLCILILYYRCTTVYSQILGISAISVINNDRIYNKRMGSNKFLDVRTIIRSFHCLPPATKRKQCFKCNVVGKLVLKSSVDTTRYLLALPHKSERARKILSIEHSSSLFLCHVTYHHERREFLPLPYKIRECNARKKRLGCRAFSEPVNGPIDLPTIKANDGKE